MRVNSQFPQPDFHRQDTRPYGLRTDTAELIRHFVDYLVPDLTPAETSVYLYLLRHTILSDGKLEIRIGKRAIAVGYGLGSRGTGTGFHHIARLLKSLAEKGCIKIGDSNAQGTHLTVLVPEEVPLVAEKIASLHVDDEDEDYFNDPEKRRLVFERDKWVCQYCGAKLAERTATIDHYVPQTQGGKHNKENLRACCHPCNSIKSGKSFEEAAPVLLKSIQERRARENQ